MFNLWKPKKKEEVLPTVTFWSMKDSTLQRATVEVEGKLKMDTSWCRFNVFDDVVNWMDEFGYRECYFEEKTV